MRLKTPHYVAIQPYDRNPQFFNLADFRMKDILQNHYQTIEKHRQKMSIETIFCLGMGPSEYIQIVRFNQEEVLLFHEMMNDLTKLNAPFMNLKETTIGLSGISDYPAIFGLKDREEIHPDIRKKFRKKGTAYLPTEKITKGDMQKQQEFLAEQGYKNPVWEYPIDKYGWDAFSAKKELRKKQFKDKNRLVSILYISHPPGWWSISDHERAQVVLEHKTLLKKYDKSIDRETIKLLGMSEPQYVTLFEYPFENAHIYNELINDIMKINAPYFEIEQTFTGIAGIGDYWLEQLKDIELKEVPMEKFSRAKWGFKA